MTVKAAVLVPICYVGDRGLVVNVDGLRRCGRRQAVDVGAGGRRAVIERSGNVEVAEVFGESDDRLGGAVKAVEFTFGGASGGAHGLA